jgi:hypothetical protein
MLSTSKQMLLSDKLENIHPNWLGKTKKLPIGKNIFNLVGQKTQLMVE